LPATLLDEGIRKSQPLPEGTTTDPKDSGGNVQSTDKGLSSTDSDEGTVDETQSTRLRYRSLTKNKGKTFSEVESDSKTLQLNTFAKVQALLLSDDDMVQESDDEEVFAAREEMDEDIPPNDEEVHSPPPHTNKPESSHAQESDYESSSPALKKYDNILPLTKRQLVKYLRIVSRVLFHWIVNISGKSMKKL
ncbi:hypothetical protein Tco_0187024, partial [Tanacetum coccineum]